MPNLSSLFTKFLFRETLTTEEKAFIRGDIGAGVPETTASIVAKLDGQTVTLDGAVLGDQGELIPALEGSLVRNHNSLAWSEDPVDDIVGGSIIYDESRSFGSVEIAAAEYASVDVRKILGSVWIPARYAVVGEVLDFLGSIKLSVNSGAAPYGTALGFVTEDYKLITGFTAGEILGLQLFDLNGNYVYPLLSGSINIAAVSGDASKVSLASVSNSSLGIGSKIPSSGNVTAGSIISASQEATGSSISKTNAGEGFELYIVMDVPTGSVPSANLSVCWDFTIRGR